MDVQQNNRERVFSILNDNTCPSFVIRQKKTTSSPPPTKLPSIASFASNFERPPFARRAEYKRASPVSSAGTPPLLRYDSSSSKSSSISMDSTPSPTTPAYNFPDTASLPYDGLRPDLGAPYLGSPTTITPFLDQQLLIAPGTHVPIHGYETKGMAPMSVTSASPYSTLPVPQVDAQQLPTPSLTNHASVSSNTSSAPSKPSPPSNSQQPTGKKNKYPCPYAASHNCLATFTTSGHAARHGKKHTGEKGVHCPICNKAFTRKDNMKQHERTHKNAANKNSDDTKSKAAITKEAQKMKTHKKSDSEVSSNAQKPNMIQSPSSEAPTLAPQTIDTPVNIPDAAFYQDPSPPLMMTQDASLGADVLVPASVYPPLGDDHLNPMSNGKSDGVIPMPPTLVRGFSDLDTLAQVAESFDPYYQTQF